MGSGVDTRARDVSAEELERPLLEYPDARAALLARCTRRDAVEVPLAAARGRVLAADVRSPHDVPGFANSSLDGYAVCADDVANASGEAPVTLTVTGAVRAGTGAAAEVQSGCAVMIATGAPLPPGADAIVPWESTDEAPATVNVGDAITVRRPATAGAVRARGEDLRAGEVVVAAGSVLGPLQLGALAIAGLANVPVIRAPRVAVLSTGDELVAPGEPAAHGARHDANSTLISALVADAGGEVVSSAALADDPDAIGGWLNDVAGTADLIITSGGVSVGRHDWLRAAIEAHGTLDSWRVAMKPGKPLALGRIGEALVCALPGNPASVIVSMHVFVLPALRSMAGRWPAPRQLSAKLTADIAGDPRRVTFFPVEITDGEDGTRAHPARAASSQVISNFGNARALAVITAGGARTGATVPVELIDSQGVC